jgi:hypothetical protein
LVYHVCTNSLIMIEMSAYSCRSTSLLLVKGGRSSSIGAGVLRPFSPSCEHNVRLIKNRVVRSDRGSLVDCLVLCRTGVCGLDGWSFEADADWAETLEVAKALRRGWRRDIGRIMLSFGGLIRLWEHHQLLVAYRTMFEVRAIASVYFLSPKEVRLLIQCSRLTLFGLAVSLVMCIFIGSLNTEALYLIVQSLELRAGCAIVI